MLKSEFGLTKNLWLKGRVIKVIIRLARKEDQDDVANLIAQFRVELKALKGIKSALKIN